MEVAQGAVPRIIDCTLREGQQAAGVKYNVKQTLHIAELLASVGVDMIECGHPAANSLEYGRVQALVKADIGTPILAHARAHRHDIEAVASAGASWVGLFLGINDKTRNARLNGCDVDEILDLISDSVAFACRLGLKVRYTLEDTSRTTLDLVHAAYSRAVAAGASRITFSDTVGCCGPQQVGQTVKWLQTNFPSVEVEVHLHDDRGLSMANSLAALKQGAHWVSCSTNGLGERCGITDLATLLANLHLEGKREVHNPQGLQQLSATVAAYSRMYPDPQRPVVGANAFTHVAKLHQTAVKRDGRAYAWIDPAALGRMNRLEYPQLPVEGTQLIVKPKAMSEMEERDCCRGIDPCYVMIDGTLLGDARQSCTVRAISVRDPSRAGSIEARTCRYDSLLMVLGREGNLTGLRLEVQLDGVPHFIESPASVLIPAGLKHRYRALSGNGVVIHHVLSGDHNSPLLSPTAEQS